MTLTDLVRSLPVARDIIQSVASVLQPSLRSSAPVSIAMLGLGIVLGAGVGLLCAPKSGRELRREISARFAGAGHEVDDLDENGDKLRDATRAMA
jgi:hypothetical protein